MALKRVRFLVQKGFCPKDYVADLPEESVNALLEEGVVELIPLPDASTEIPSRDSVLGSDEYLKSRSSKKES